MWWPFKKRSTDTEPKVRKTPKMGQIRGYSAAKLDRLSNGWLGSSESINEMIRQGSNRIRQRARELAMNDSYARKYLKMVKENVIGPAGMILQSKVTTARGKQDDRANTRIESRFKLWGKKGRCTICGTLSWVNVQKVSAVTWARDGEMLLLTLIDRATKSLRLQMIDVDRLDPEFNDERRNIRRSIEYDENRRPVAYWIMTRHPGEAGGYYSKKYERYPAEQVIHVFDPEVPEQERAVSEMVAAMSRMKMLDGYEEAELVGARVGASNMGFFTSPDGEGGPYDDENSNDGLIMEAEPGTFRQLPDGVQFTAFNPQHPGGNFDPFTKRILRGIASGLSISYNTMASDMEGVSYSSIRTAVLEERDHWKEVQMLFKEHLHDVVFARWLMVELMFGNLDGYGPADYEALNQPNWQARGWSWVDPQKDINASIDAIKNNLKTHSDVVAEQGKDFEEVLQQLAKERELMAKYGLTTGDITDA